jgi:hypothetical protein
MFPRIVYYFIVIILIAGLIGYLTEPSEDNTEPFEATTPLEIEKEASLEESDNENNQNENNQNENNQNENNQNKENFKDEEITNVFRPKITIRMGNNKIGSFYASPKTGSKDFEVNLSDEELNKIMNVNNNKYQDSKNDDNQDPWDTIIDNQHLSKFQEKKNNLVQYNLLEDIEKKNNPLDAKDFYPGYQLIPPKEWDVPQPRPPVCIPQKYQLPSAVILNGIGTNVLELDKTGKMAVYERDVSQTNVGSILPKFKYQEYTGY